MNTSQIKTFAQQLRIQLREGVKQRLLYWGFNDQGEVIEQPETVEGGYMFRGQVYSDETVPDRWKQLKRTIDLHNIDYVVEEGAYTWFNRLMAIRILERNDYIQPQLEYEDGTTLPYLLQNARRGIFPEMQRKDLEEVEKQLKDNKDNEAFARLLTHYCDTQLLISRVFGEISFRDDYTEMLLPQNLLDQDGILEFIVNTAAITDEDYQQVELIGWLYQYYISKKKGEVFQGFSKNIKASEEKIPAATQFFTPEWIVRYMVENTVGKQWLDLHPTSPVRSKLKYLVKPSDKSFSEPIINNVSELTLLDPAVGSGHILVIGFEYLIMMYREEGYTARQAVDSILKNNLYGIEIDERAAQLARFAIILKAAKYDNSILEGATLPNVHSFPEKTNISRFEVREFLGAKGDQYFGELSNAIDLLQLGKNLGSIIQVEISIEAIDFIKNRLSELHPKTKGDLNLKQLVNKIEPFISLIDLLNKKYKAVAANPPYMKNGNMNSSLKEFIEEEFKLYKYDLFSVFMERSFDFLELNGSFSMINQQVWMFKKSYKKLRDDFLNKITLTNLIHLGKNAFPDISGEVVRTVAFTIVKNIKHDVSPICYDLNDFKDTTEKERAFLKRECEYSKIKQSAFLNLPGSPIAYWIDDKSLQIIRDHPKLSDVADAKPGLQTSDNPRFLRYWFEVEFSKIGIGLQRENALNSNYKWFPHNKGGKSPRKWFGSNLIVINFKNDGKELKYWIENNPNDPSTNHWSRNLRNYKFYFREGVTWSAMTSKYLTARLNGQGYTFDVSGPTLFSDNNEFFCGLINTKVFRHFLDFFTQAMGKSSTYFKNVPIIKSQESKISTIVIELKKLAEKDWNDSEISWQFNGSRLVGESSSSLKEQLEIYKEKLSYDFYKSLNLEVYLNRVFNKIYSLDNEIDYKIPPTEITLGNRVILKDKIKIADDKYELFSNEVFKEYDFLPAVKCKEENILKDLISYFIGCIFGRFKIGEKGLYITNNKPYELSYKINEQKFTINRSGIVPVVGEYGPFFDDLIQLIKNIVEKIYGDNHLTDNLNVLQRVHPSGLEEYLMNEFWKDHLTKYKNRPIYWLFSSTKGSFQVLVYMHRIDKYTVQRIRQNYLHPFIDFIRDEINMLDSKESLQSDETKKLDSLRSKLVECVEYDEVIKKIADKQIEIDLDDGVQYNYELFGDALAKI